MPIVKRFVASNGQPVTKLLTPSGVIAYVADEIPLEALQAWHIQLSKELGLPVDAELTPAGPSHSHGKGLCESR
jgi:hypothetical protein